MSKYLEELNNNQKIAVEHEDGPMLIVAGAGTGKTKVLINRFARLVEKGVDQNKILIVTFTEKAANELEERADKLLPMGAVNLWIRTFHGLANDILKRHALDIGLSPDNRVLSEAEAWILVKKNLSRFKLDYYKPLGNPNKFIGALLKHFSRLKDENISSLEYLEYAQNLKADEDNILSGSDEEKLTVSRIRELAEAYHIYNQILLENGVMDYADMLCFAIKLFKERPNILIQYQKQFEYIMVDEFQDTNLAQYQLVKLLINTKQSIVVVGDDDQAIYKFRGASLSNILQFRTDYPGAKAVVLNDNYRSGQNILDAAYSFINHNNPNRLEIKENLDKRLKSHNDSVGSIEHWSLPDQAAEATAVAKKIIDIQANGLADWSEIAVLSRANNSSDRFVREFMRQNIPFEHLSRKGLYYKPIILDICAYLRLLDNYHESSAVFRILATSAFKMSHADMVELIRENNARYYSLYEGLKEINSITKVSPEGIVAANKLVNSVTKHAELAKTKSAAEIIVSVASDIFYPFLDRDRNIEDFRLLSELYKKALKLENDLGISQVRDLMDYIDLELEAGESGAMPIEASDFDTVKISTVHSSKGLEFKYVFVVDLVDRRFPSSAKSDLIPVPDGLAKENLPDKDMHLEEERRLFYVAMTRAKEGLFLTSARDAGGKTEKKPSKFISEAEVATLAFNLASEGTELDRAIERVDIPFVLQLEKYLPKHFSFTALEAYKNCPLQYQYAQVLRLPILKQGANNFGQLLHKVLYEFLLPLLPGSVKQTDLFGNEIYERQEISFERLKEIYEKNWSERGYDSKEDALKFYAQGKQFIKIFYDDLVAGKNLKIFGLEHDFKMSFSEAFLKGSIDFVEELPDGTLAIMDYKSGKPKDKLDYQSKRQLILYKIALENQTNKKVSKLAYYYFQSGQKMEFETKPSEEDKLLAEAKETIESVKKMDFHPTPGENCRWCDFRTICQFRK